MQRFYYVLHALRRCRVTKLIPWKCPHSPFTHFESMPGTSNKADSLGVPTFIVSIVFHTLCVDDG